MSESIQAYPLCWPAGQPRTPSYQRESGSFTGKLAAARDALTDEIDRMMNGRVTKYHIDAVISTNMPARKDGTGMLASASEPADPGVAIYFKRKGKQVCFACDRYDRVWKNLKALQKTLEALRGIERWGSAELLDRAFTGFAALPAPGPRKWHDVMGIPAESLTVDVRSRYKQLARARHPDTGGSHEMFTELGEAWEAFQRERGLA